MRVRLAAEIEIPGIWCDPKSPEEIDWLMKDVLGNELILFSNLVGDEIGALENVKAEILK